MRLLHYYILQAVSLCQVHNELTIPFTLSTCVLPVFTCKQGVHIPLLFV